MGRGPGSEHRVASGTPEGALELVWGSLRGPLVWELDRPLLHVLPSKFTSVSVVFWQPLCLLPARNK